MERLQFDLHEQMTGEDYTPRPSRSRDKKYHYRSQDFQEQT